MTNREEDIKRYLQGEMTPAEQHALEKAALSDPFLAEALEGLSNLTEAELAEDLENISAELETQTEYAWQVPAAGAKRKAASEAAASMAADQVEMVTVQVPANPKRNWWPLRVAALLIVLIGGYLIVPRLFNKPKAELALQQETKPEAPVAGLTDTSTVVEKLLPEEKINLPTSRSIAKAKELPAKPVVTQERKDSITNSVLEELAEGTKVVSITKDPLTLKQPEEKPAEVTEVKKEAQPELRSKVATTPAIIISGKVIAEEDQTPLPGVNVLIKGTTIGAVTDMNGHYQLTSNLPNVTLQYSFVGLQTEEVTVKQPGEVNIEMKTDVSQLSEVVITGYSPSGVDPNREPVIKLAQPAGGLKAYDKYLKNSLRYPQQALESNVKGRVTVSFTVHTDGRVDAFNVLKGLGFGCDEEVIRLVKDGPRWSPTTQDGEPVESEVRVRVKFAPPAR
ncbi:MAG: TonB family protein [Cyclobacteriaceae bacterium]|nr:TonB family protein [Cyclobacteriaceae bacterium]